MSSAHVRVGHLPIALGGPLGGAHDGNGAALLFSANVPSKNLIRQVWVEEGATGIDLCFRVSSDLFRCTRRRSMEDLLGQAMAGRQRRRNSSFIIFVFGRLSERFVCRLLLCFFQGLMPWRAVLFILRHRSTATLDSVCLGFAFSMGEDACRVSFGFGIPAYDLCFGGHTQVVVRVRSQSNANHWVAFRLLGTLRLCLLDYRIDGRRCQGRCHGRAGFLRGRRSLSGLRVHGEEF